MESLCMTRHALTATLAYLTADTPGTGGRIKLRPGDFLVEEIPLYEACGQGEHLYLFLQKEGRTTTDVVRRLAKLFNVRRSDIGYAGLKDKHAITRQQFSIHLPRSGEDQKSLERIGFTGLKLIWAARHTNKLRRGHLAGNRFTIQIREVDPAAVLPARRILDRLVADGVPNFVGEQRFGYRQNNHILGRLLLQQRWQELLDTMLGGTDAEDAPDLAAGRRAYAAHDYPTALEHWPRRLHQERQALDLLRQGKDARTAVLGMDSLQLEFLLNALQSDLFNRVLDERLGAGTFGRLLPGDIACKHDNGALFAVDEATATTENAPDGRATQKLISPTGPMWGARMLQPQGVVRAAELRLLEAAGLTESLFTQDRPPHGVPGDRRPLRTIVTNPDLAAGADEAGPFLRLQFDLPPGSYATIVLREIMKPELTGTSLNEEDRAEG